ncbi:hypothetical protein LSAT2_030021 [Lamellibrachia satsuma]|nr:hypothetical protein LSAT2_030021 [Lamellibrachia satsuma]
MEELKDDVCVKESFRMKPVRSRLNWAGHVKRMEGGRVTKGADTLRVSCRKRRRPRLRWENCVKRDLVELGGNGEREQWEFPNYGPQPSCGPRDVAQYAKDHLNCNTIRLKLSSDEETSYPLDLFTGIECEDDNINDLCDLLSTMFRTQDDIARFIITHITHEDEQHNSKFYDGSSDGAVQSEISDVTKMDSISAEKRADAIPKALMPPEKDPFGIVTEMFEAFIDLDYTSGTLLVTEVAPFKSTDYLTNGDMFDA